jgi:hypothetical protein
MIQNEIVLWMCFIAGWALVVFVGIGGVYVLISRLWGMFKYTQKALEWQRKCRVAERKVYYVTNGRCLFCGGDMKYVSPIHDSHECQSCFAIRCDDGRWHALPAKEPG